MLWIARDRNGMLCVYRTKPSKDTEHGVWAVEDLTDFITIDDGSAFTEVQWEDELPRELITKPF